MAFEGFDISQLPPEVLQQLLSMSTMDEQSEDLDRQLAIAQALQQPQSGGHRTALAAGIGGLGDAFRAFGGTMKASKAGGQKEELRKQKLSGREKFAQLLAGHTLKGGGQRPEEWENPFGYGGPA